MSQVAWERGSAVLNLDNYFATSIKADQLSVVFLCTQITVSFLNDMAVFHSSMKEKALFYTIIK